MNLIWLSLIHGFKPTFHIDLPKHGSNNLGSWAWLSSLPTCSHLHITLYVLTKNLHGLLLFTADARKSSHNSFLVLQIAGGRPQLILRLGSSATAQTVTLDSIINDNRWHRIDIVWRKSVSNSVYNTNVLF